MSKSKKPDLLFSDFPPVTKEAWIKKAISDLKGADFDKKLGWVTPEGFKVDPFYTREDIDKLDYLDGFQQLLWSNKESDVSPRHWLTIEKILITHESAAAKTAHAALHSGADGIIFQIPKHKDIDLNKLMDAVRPDINPVRFSSSLPELELVNTYLTHIQQDADLNPEAIEGGLDFDIIKSLSLTGTLDDKHFGALTEIIRNTTELPGFKSLTVNGGYLLNAGATAVQEMAYTLSIITDYIDRLTAHGLPPEEVISNLEVSLSVGTNYFMEIAKVRSFRLLLFEVLKMYNIHDLSPADIHIHCESSLWTKTIYDPYVNMLRNTTEAMSAIIGGCNSITIQPFDEVFSPPGEFSRRISRNILNILKEESYFDKVSDPASGSYYIESLSDRLIDHALPLFHETEKNGGYIRQFRDGIIRKKIHEARNNKFDLIAKRKKIFVGTNQYPNPEEKIRPEELSPQCSALETDDNILTETRGGYHFEKLRKDTDLFAQRHGEDKRPSVFLSLIGDNKIMRKARASFAWGFFGCAGFKITESNPSESLFKAVDKAIRSKADIVVMCGADEDYVELGIDYAKAFKGNSKGLLVIAGNPEENKEALHAAGIDDRIHIRTNIIESLSNFQKRLNVV